MTPAPVAHQCRVEPGCPGLALWGYADPLRPQAGVLWACAAHRDAAEERWRKATGRGR